MVYASALFFSGTNSGSTCLPGAYDLWGDTVNTAARMESHGIPGEIQVTPETQALLKPNYHLEERGWIDIKGKGLLQVYLLKGKR